MFAFFERRVWTKNSWKNSRNPYLRSRRRPEETALYRLVHSLRDDFEWNWGDRFESSYGVLGSGGEFLEMPCVDNEYLQRIFARNVFSFLKDKGLLSDEDITSMQSWSHSGFNAFVGEPFCDADARLFVARYLKKCPLSNKRLELIEESGEVTVRYHKIADDIATHRDFEPLEFLAELQQHIPDKWEQTTRYMGTYSSRARGAKRLRETVSDSEHEPLPEPRIAPTSSWAACMKKIFEVDPLVCKKCGASMKIKSFMKDSHEITRLAKNLGVVPWRAPPPIPRTISLAA